MFSSYRGVIAASANLGAGVPTRSLDFESGSTQYLSMSSANWGAYDRAKYAISVWVKRESTADTAFIFQKGDNGSREEVQLFFQTAGELDVRSYVGGSINGRLLTTATYTSTSTWYHILYHFDSANGTAGDRMRLWVNGSEVTSFSTDTNPSSATSTDTGIVYIGASGAVSSTFDGLIYQMAFFSGVLPSIGQVYNAGAPRDVSSIPGLWSLLNTNASDALTDDYVLVPAWTNNNTVVKSTTIP